jgi:general secretion pathway protein F
MATFEYKAVDRHGRISEGTLEAADPRAASFNLQEMGLIPVAVGESTRQAARAASGLLDPSRGLRFAFGRVRRRDILHFTESLTTLVGAGLPLDRSLVVTAELTSNPMLAGVIRNVLGEIKGGKSLAEALALYPKHFSPLYVNMIRAGEAGGVLDVILERLTEFERSADELRSYLVSSLVYPVLLTLVGLGSLGILFFFVIPRFGSIFEDVGAGVPPSAALLLAVAEAARAYWWVLPAAIVAVVAGFRAWLRTDRGRHQWDRFALRVPMFGPTVLKVEVATFARTLGTLLHSSVPLIQAVRIVQGVVGNSAVRDAISRVADGAKRGEGVSGPMTASGVFPPLANHLVAVGEESGRLDSMLLQLADAYDRDVRSSVKALTSVLEPAIILVMGVVIGTVVLSMLTAIFSINEIAF